MSIQLSQRFSILIGSLLVVGMALTEFLIVQSTHFAQQTDLMSLAITVDLTVLLPIVFYFLVVKKLNINPSTMLGVFIGSCGLASLILPKNAHHYLDYVWLVLPLIEVGVLAWVIWKLKTVFKTYKTLSLSRFDFHFNLRDSFQTVFGDAFAFRLLATELSVLRYGLLPFWGKIEVLPYQKAFSTHQKSAYAATWTAILIAGFVELFVFHFLLAKWNNVAVIVGDILGIYTLIMLVADFNMVFKRPILIDFERLTIRLGIRWNTTIELSDIESIELTKRVADKTGLVEMTNFTTPNVLIKLHQNTVVQGFYGIKKQAKALAISVDKPEEFAEALKKAISKSEIPPSV